MNYLNSIISKLQTQLPSSHYSLSLFFSLTLSSFRLMYLWTPDEVHQNGDDDALHIGA